MSLLPDYYLLRGGAGGGIKIVSELPDPVQGKQPLIVYVERDYYESGGTHTAAQTTFTVTPAALGGDSIGGAPMPALTYVSNIFQDNNRHIYVQMTNLLVPLAEAARPNGLGVSVEVDAAAGVALGDFGSTRLQTGPSATRWVVGTDVAVRFRRGDGRYLAADGEFYEVRPDDDPLIKENFYHVSPETGLWVEGLGLAEGGLPGAVLHEAGLSDADVRNHDWRGVLVGLSREDSGGDWRMATVPGRDAVQASVRISAAGSSSLLVTLGPVTGGHAAAGAEGNNWRIRVTDAGGNAVTAGNQAAGTILVGIPAAGATLIQVRDAINVITGVDATSFGGGTAFPRVNGAPTDEYVFAGGLDAEEMGVAYDEATKIVTLTHLSGHTQQEIVEFLDANELDADTTLYAILLGGSDPAAMIDDAPLSRPFVNVFSRGSLPRPSSDEIDARVQALVKPYALDGGPLIAGSDAAASFVLEPEITQAFLLGIIGLTQAELNKLFLDARVTGAGAARSVVIDRKDGSTVTLALGDTTGGTGGGGGADGVLSGIEFAGDGSTLTARVAEADGTTTTYTINVPAALRQAGLSQQLVQNLIESYLQDYDTAVQVAAQIATNLSTYRPFASVSSKSADYEILASDRGDTIRATGAAALTFTVDPTIPAGWWARLLNNSTAVLTFDVGVTSRIEGAGRTLEIAAGDCVALQYLGASTWAVITDTAGAAASGGGEAARELEVMAPVRVTNTNGAASVQWPADYASYKNYEVVTGDDEGVTDTIRGTTAFLALQQDGDIRIFVGDKDEAGSRKWLSWTPSTRTMTPGQQGTNTNVRIKSARLYDNGGGGSGEVPDGSLTAAKMDVSTAAKQAAFRAAFQSAHISVRNDLPPIADANIGSDVVILSAGIADGISIVDISDPNTPVTAAEVGDILFAMMFRAAVWTRVGNIITGRGDATARAAAMANALEISSLQTTVNAVRLTLAGLEGNLPDPPVPSAEAAEKKYILTLPAAGSASTRATWDEFTESGEDATARASATAALARTQRLRPISQYVRWGGAQTVFLEWKPVGAVANNAAIQVNMGGFPITGVTAPEALTAEDTNGLILELSITDANAQNLDRAAHTSAGHVEIQILHGGVVDTTWMGVTLPTGWRTLAGGSPYTVRTTDIEFKVVFEHSGTQVEFDREVSKERIGTVSKNFGVGENNPGAGSDMRWMGAALSLNAAGNQLTVAEAGSRATETEKYTIAAVLAR